MNWIYLLTLLVLALREVNGDSGTCNSSPEEKKRPADAVPPKHFNIILIGATGNLASKYLWRSLFEIFKQRFDKNAVRFHIYGCARKDANAGRKFMSDMLLNLITCHDDACREIKTKFVEATQYLRLKTERDFKDLSEKLLENTQSVYGLQGSPVTYEEGRLVYMSIPPSTYAKTAKYVSAYLRPKVGRPWMRIVLEKPFGQDLESAQSLVRELSEYFEENEMYRVDHYLGKTVVKQILPFRYINKAEFEPLWNRDHIEQIEIVMKEKDDVAGRTDFYNEVGIVRDVMQNHLTEMLALVAMDLPSNSGNISEILQSKVRVLRQVRLPNRQTTLMAQYTSYNMEWMKDDVSANVSTVPTFAASALFIDNSRWAGVPFLLMSGKKLDEKASYVRVRFRNSRMCMRVSDETCVWRKQIVFNIGGGSNVHMPAMIAVSRGLPTPRLRPGWSVLPPTEMDVNIFGQSPKEMTQHVPDLESDPYVELINAVFDGARNMFTSTDLLLASWKLWTPILHLTEGRLLRQYIGRGKDSERLDFIVTSRGLQWQLNDRDEVTYDITDSILDVNPTYGQVPTSFRNSTLVSGSTKSVIHSLATRISDLAEDARVRQDSFHIAVSGGSSAPTLFEELAETLISWDHVHVWMVDERCVPPNSEHSNYNLLQRHLLSKTDILHWNVHPMISMTESCESKLSDVVGSQEKLYEDTVNRLVPESTFDFVILGVGNDGHTASLFPDQTSLDESEKLVVLSITGKPEDEKFPVQKRVTLTFTAINKAKNIAILTLGEAKHAILKSIAEINDVKKLPVTGVKPVNGMLTWYVDHEALFGK